MNAPDKIYIDGDIIPFNSINERLSDKDVEYIRKDALLEWAEKKVQRLEGTEGDYTEGYVHALLSIEYKLNSM